MTKQETLRLRLGIAKNDPRLALKGVRLHGNGWEVAREVAGKPRRTPMALTTTGQQLLTEWERLAAAVAAPMAGSLADAARDYLTTVEASPTYAQRVRHLGLWLQELGRDRSPASVTTADVDRVIQKWLKVPTIISKGSRGGRPSSPTGLDGETIRKRIAVLCSFFIAVLPDGTPNPVTRCKRPKAKKAATRGIPMADVVRLLAAMPDDSRYHRAGKEQQSLAKIRATVTAFTGLDPAQIGALDPGDLMLSGTDPYYRIGRNKGDGVAVQVVPLTEPGRLALQAFVAANAFGPYSSHGVNRAVQKAAAKVGGIPAGFRQKDLRHSFLTEMYRLTSDIATVARFALHEPGSAMTVRYTRAAHETVDRTAAAKFVVPAPEQPAGTAKVLRMRKRSGG
jgi:integrase